MPPNPARHQSGPKVQPLSPATVVPKRVQPGSNAFTLLQRAMRSWPALLLLVACAVGMVATPWNPWGQGLTRHSTTTTGSATTRATTSTTLHTAPVTLPTLKSEKDSTPELNPLPETDLSRFPPDAHLHTSLIDLPSTLVPPSWLVESDLGPLPVKRIFADPLILTMDRFLSPSECEGLVATAHRVGFERSMTTTGIVSSRTSESAFLPENDPFRATMLARASNFTHTPSENFEVGPIIRYEIGQKFDAHWDSTRDETFGRRLTLFIPLQSEPGEDGGHTAFPLLDYRFPPLNGSAILFRNFLPEAPEGEYDLRLKHAGEPPKRGRKYAINIWIYAERYIHWTLRPKAEQNAVKQGLVFPPLAGGRAPELQLPIQKPGALDLVNTPEGDLPLEWLQHSSTGVLRVRRLTPSPLLARIPDFLSLRERQELILEGNKYGWTPSETIAGFSQSRTSSTAWLYNLPIQTVVERRVAQLVGVAPEQVEANALTRYRVGEFYRPHYDSQPNSVPHRRVSIVVPLSMEPEDEDNASVHFPLLNLTLPQRAGTALLWRNYRPGQSDNDPLMLHGYNAPQRGEVYALTIFVFPHPIREKQVYEDEEKEGQRYVDYRDTSQRTAQITADKETSS